MSRKSAREAAFKTIFEIPFHCDQSPQEIIDFTVENASKEINTENDKNYFKNVTGLCQDKLNEIDSEVSLHLKSDWTIDRLSKINLAILRLAVCEILYMDDIPYQVSINEAVELAKKYSDDDSPAFINGILALINR